MKVIILSAGQGSRLLPLTEDRPKCLLDLGGDTLLGVQLKALKAGGATDVVIVTGFRTAAVEAAAADEPDFFWSPINTLDDLLADPQFVASGALVDVPDEPGSPATTTMVATPVDYSRTGVAPRSLAPGLGQHTAEILEELGRAAT